RARFRPRCVSSRCRGRSRGRAPAHCKEKQGQPPGAGRRAVGSAPAPDRARCAGGPGHGAPPSSPVWPAPCPAGWAGVQCGRRSNRFVLPGGAPAVARKKDNPPPPKKPKELEAEVRALLKQPLDDAALRGQLEALAAEPAFNGLTYLWGPELYRRNRVLFRPFILDHFAAAFQTLWEWKPVRWKDHAAALDAWLEEVD